MSFSNRLLTGSALCLLMAAPSAFAEAQDAGSSAAASAPIILAQADGGQAPAAECPPGTTASADGCVPAQGPAQPPAAPPEETAPPQGEAPAEPQAEEPSAPEQPQEAPAGPEQPSAPEPAPKRPAEEPAAPEQPAEPQQAPEQPAPEQPAEQPQEAPAETQEAPAEQSAPAEQPSDAAPAQQAPVEQVPAPEQQAPAEAAPPAEPPAPEAPAEAPADAAPAPAPEAPADGAPPLPAQPDTGQQTPPAEGQPAPEQGQGALPDNAAPVLDSQKGAPEQAQPGAQPTEGQPQDQQAQPAEPVPLPQSDSEAQQIQVQPEQVQQDIRSIVEEQGQRIDIGQTPQDRAFRRAEIFQRPPDANVVQEFNDNRTIVEINNQVYVRSSDYDRLVRQDDTVYYEELRNGRVREVVERRDGSRLITIRNRYGDVVRRVRVLPDGREYVMVYVPEDRFDRVEPFRDPGLDLPPMRLTIPVDQYILDAERVQDVQGYYTFLAEPPVEPVERLYSIDEVRYSARIRDKVRRIDLDTIQFEFGAATISDSEIGRLENLANAIIEMLEKNPAETFLLEGHTDAVGSENANLALSDRRAEAVAVALTNVFNIPPENLVTQGYGEQYLKINTQEPERENRRVAVRRITPLVTPVAIR